MIENRGEAERIWWNKFSDIMAMQWEMTPYLNKVLRKSMIDDFSTFLYKENGKVLDLGCGNGWISRIFADLNMDVVGVDFSKEQIDFSKEMISKNLNYCNKINFVCDNITNLDSNIIGKNFDSVIISALLHHLTSDEMKQVFIGLEKVMVPNGRIYLYEPIIFDTYKNKFKYYKFSYMFFVKLKDYLFRIMGKLNMISHKFVEAQKNGYTGISPHEAPFTYSTLAECLNKYFTIKEVRPLHGFNIGWGTFQMAVKPIPGYFLKICTPLVNALDRKLLSMKQWPRISNHIWLLSGIKIEYNEKYNKK